MDLRHRISRASQMPKQLQDQQRNFVFNQKNIDTGPRGNSIPRPSRRKQVPYQHSSPKKPTIQKYYRTGSAPKNQFNRCLMDTANIFYEDRQSARQLESVARLKQILLFLFPILLSTFLLTNLIQPYPGQCPKNAKCGVYIHCSIGYELSPSGSQCLVAAGIIDEAENLCSETIEQLLYDYGDTECRAGGDSFPPYISLDDIFEGLTGQTAGLVKEKAIVFLQNQENQKTIGFDFFDQTIVATEKKQSFACKLRLFFKSYAFFIGGPIVLMTIALIGYVHLQIGNSRRAKAIYEELRNLVLRDKIVNITNMKGVLEERHGEIDENLWGIIDSHRIRDRDIGFLQDDFLYWKLL